MDYNIYKVAVIFTYRLWHLHIDSDSYILTKICQTRPPLWRKPQPVISSAHAYYDACCSSLGLVMAGELSPQQVAELSTAVASAVTRAFSSSAQTQTPSSQSQVANRSSSGSTSSVSAAPPTTSRYLRQVASSIHTALLSCADFHHFWEEILEGEGN